MQIHRTFKGDMAKRAGWGERNIPPGTVSSSSSRASASRPSTVTNEFIAEANDFDKAKVHADADGYVLPEDLAAIDMAGVEASFYRNAIN